MRTFRNTQQKVCVANKWGSAAAWRFCRNMKYPALEDEPDIDVIGEAARGEITKGAIEILPQVS